MKRSGERSTLEFTADSDLAEPPTKRLKLSNDANSTACSNDRQLEKLHRIGLKDSDTATDENDVITQRDKDTLFISIAKCDVATFDSILAKLEQNKIAKTTIQEWQHSPFHKMDEQNHSADDIKILQWVYDAISSKPGYVLEYKCCFLCITFTLLFCELSTCTTDSIKTCFDFTALRHIIDVLQRDCGCSLVKEIERISYIGEEISLEDSVHASSDDKIRQQELVHAASILDVSGLDLLSMCSSAWCYDGEGNSLSHLQWHCFESYAKCFVAPLVANGAVFYPLSELFDGQEWKLQDLNENNELLKKLAKMWKEKNWSGMLCIDGDKEIFENITEDWSECYDLADKWMVDEDTIKTFVLHVLNAKYEYFQKRRKAMIVLMGMHPRIGKNSSLLKFKNARSFEPNLIKLIFEFSALCPFRANYA